MALGDKDRKLEKPATDLLRRSLASLAGAPGSDPGSEIGACPDPEILAAYSERSLDAAETARYELHFSQCARCREQLSALVDTGELAGTAEEKRSRKPGWASTWDWRWLAPATAAILFVVIVTMFRPPHRPAEQRMVAMNQPATPPANAPAAPEDGPTASAPATGAAGSLARESSNLNSAKADIAPPPRVLDEKQRAQDATSTQFSSRGGEALYKITKPAEMKKSEASSPAANSAAAGSVSESVTVDAAVAPPKPPARVSTEPVPPDISSGTSAGAVSPAPAAPKSSRSEHLAATMTMNRSAAQNETVVVEAAEQTSARTLVRTPDPQILWRFSGGRFVERSSDAGTTWHVQWTSPNARLVAGAAPTTDTCWLVGRDAMILVTTDGRKWKTIAPPAETDFVDVAATDASSATITSADGRKFTTSDRGDHWTPAP